MTNQDHTRADLEAMRRQQRARNAAAVGGFLGAAWVNQRRAKKIARAEGLAEAEAEYAYQQDLLAAEAEQAERRAHEQRLSDRQYAHGLAMWRQTPLGRAYTAAEEPARAATAFLSDRDRAWAQAWRDAAHADGLAPTTGAAPVRQPSWLVLGWPLGPGLIGTGLVLFGYNVVAWLWNHSWFTRKFHNGNPADPWRGTREFWATTSVYLSVAAAVLGVLALVAIWWAENRASDRHDAQTRAHEAALSADRARREGAYGFDPFAEDPALRAPWHDGTPSPQVRAIIQRILTQPYTQVTDADVSALQAVAAAGAPRLDTPSGTPAQARTLLEQWRR